MAKSSGTINLKKPRMGWTPELICTCGQEPVIQIDMASGPGCLCHIECSCGANGNQVWDVRVPWADLLADWNDPAERELRRALKMGFVTRADQGRYMITDLGRAVVEAEFGGNDTEEYEAQMGDSEANAKRYGALDEDAASRAPSWARGKMATELVYSYLLNEHHNALRKGDVDKANRIFIAAEVFAELWPEDVKRWEARFPGKST